VARSICLAGFLATAVAVFVLAFSASAMAATRAENPSVGKKGVQADVRTSYFPDSGPPVVHIEQALRTREVPGGHYTLGSTAFRGHLMG